MEPDHSTPTSEVTGFNIRLWRNVWDWLWWWCQSITQDLCQIYHNIYIPLVRLLLAFLLLFLSMYPLSMVICQGQFLCTHISYTVLYMSLLTIVNIRLLIPTKSIIWTGLLWWEITCCTKTMRRTLCTMIMNQLKTTRKSQSQQLK